MSVSRVQSDARGHYLESAPPGGYGESGGAWGLSGEALEEGSTVHPMRGERADFC